MEKVKITYMAASARAVSATNTPQLPALGPLKGKVDY